MKKSILLTLLLVCLLPSMLIWLFDISDENLDRYIVEQPVKPETTVPTNPVSNVKQEEPVSICVQKNESIEKMLLEEYVLSVVLAEMPVDFEIEALKAQAVVARTYTCRKMEKPKHNNAHVCTDSRCCQAYMDIAQFLSSGGTREDLEKVQSAVESTSGLVLLYRGELIDATYFSCSGGKTEDAAAVWGSAVPYLQSVESPGEEYASHYIDTVQFSVGEFAKKMGLELTENPGTWIKNVKYTSGGGVASVVLQGKTFSGTEIRQKLGLRSTAFVITITGETVTITTKGFGHRVGMSQYGAEAMAVQGSNYQEILNHYYTDITISSLSG